MDWKKELDSFVFRNRTHDRCLLKRMGKLVYRKDNLELPLYIETIHKYKIQMDWNMPIKGHDTHHDEEQLLFLALKDDQNVYTDQAIVRTVKYLLDLKCDPCVSNYGSEYMPCAYARSKSIAELLVPPVAARISATELLKQTYYASAYNRLEVVYVFIKNGADLLYDEHDCNHSLLEDMGGFFQTSNIDISKRVQDTYLPLLRVWLVRDVSWLILSYFVKPFHPL